MADPLSIRTFYAALSANFSSKTDLSTLLKAAYAALTPPQTIPDICATELILFAAGTNARSILVGDSNLTTSNFGFALPATAPNPVKIGTNNKCAIPLSNIFVIPEDGATNVKIGITAIPE